jgi:CubicO group peptidase (beta-lactamase class C family)
MFKNPALERALIKRQLPVRIFAAVVILSLVSQNEEAISRADDGPARKAAQIDDLIRRYEQCGYLNGAVLVAEHGRTIYEKGVGQANMESHTPNTPRIEFGIASITKQFTAALVFQLAAEGKLRLNGTVSEYLPWYRKDTGSRMTVEQLVHHTSGLPADYNSPEFCDTAEARRHFEPREFAEKFCQLDLVAEPGQKWAYSNRGYVLLGLILEQVTGKSFGNLLSEQVLVPLGMKHTGMDGNDSERRGGALGYERHAGPRYTPGPPLDRIHCFAAGAMYSTVEDLFRWNQALSTDELFSRNLRAELFEPGLQNWAGGWFVTKIPEGQPGAGNPMAEMRGDMPGNYFAWVLRYPKQDAVIIVLRNVYGSTEHLEENLQAILFDRPPHFPSRSPKDLVAHAGQVSFGALTHHGLLAVLFLFVLGAAVLLRSAGRRQKDFRQPKPHSAAKHEALNG